MTSPSFNGASRPPVFLHPRRSAALYAGLSLSHIEAILEGSHVPANELLHDAEAGDLDPVAMLRKWRIPGLLTDAELTLFDKAVPLVPGSVTQGLKTAQINYLDCDLGQRVVPVTQSPTTVGGVLEAHDGR